MKLVLSSQLLMFIVVCYFFTALMDHRATANSSPINLSPFFLHAWPEPCQHRITVEKDYLLTQQDKLQARVATSQDVILYIGASLKKFKLPAWIIWLPLLESGYRQNAVSNAGAAGLWQLMPDTARRFGLTVSALQDDRFDVDKSTVAALTYLRWLYEHFDHDWSLALAGYNAGEKRISSAQQKAKLNDFCDLQLPVETQHYVPRLIAMSEILAQLPSTLPTGNVPFLFRPKTVDLGNIGPVVHLEMTGDRWLLPKETEHPQGTLLDMGNHTMMSLTQGQALVPELQNQTGGQVSAPEALPRKKLKKSMSSESK